jgi:hypothetical protein
MMVFAPTHRNQSVEIAPNFLHTIGTTTPKRHKKKISKLVIFLKTKNQPMTQFFYE